MLIPFSYNDNYDEKKEKIKRFSNLMNKAKSLKDRIGKFKDALDKSNLTQQQKNKVLKQLDL